MVREMMDLQATLDRLADLERQNRTFKRVCLAALAVLSAVVVMGQAAPGARAIEAQEFLLKDSAGTTRAVFSMLQSGPGLVLYDDNGNARGAFLSTASGPSIRFYDTHGSVIWSEPATTIATRSAEATPKVFIEVWSGSWALKPEQNANPQSEMSQFAETCLQAVVTTDRQKADYVVRLDHHLASTFLRQQNPQPDDYRDFFRYSVFDKEGNMIGTGSNTALGGVIGESCRAIQKAQAVR